MEQAVSAGQDRRRPTPEEAPRAERLARAIGKMLTAQARRGTLTGVGGALILGLLFVPAVGPAAYGAWLAVLCAMYALRDVLVWRAGRRDDPQHLVRVTAYSSATLALVIAASAPLFFPSMSDSARALLSAVNAGWAAMAAMVIGIHPAAYRLYLVISFGLLALAWWLHGNVRDALLLTLMLASAGSMQVRFSQRLRAAFEESFDIRHEKEQLLQKLGVAVRRQEAAERERSRLLAAASHDLLQPVHALLLLTGLLSSSTDDTRREELITHVKATASSIDGMFRGLLDQARIDAGTLVARREPVQVLTLARAVQGGAEARAQPGVAVHVRVHADQWALGDPALVERVLRNLVDNALKFTRHGSVAIDCTRLDGDLELTVSDTGIGVEAQELALLCQPFFRGQAARDAESDGIGLGLANAMRMVQLMDGQLAIESVRGEGTTVRVQLPRWNGPAQARPAAHEVFDGVRFERVLVIDDDRGAREAISLWLSSAGCEVLQAAHYGAAVAGCEARAFRPDLLMVDYRLGESLDGLHAIARLRKRFGPVEAMLVTGEPLDEATLPGDVVLLRKPLHPERLEALLGRA